MERHLNSNPSRIFAACVAGLLVACGEAPEPSFEDPLDGKPFAERAELAAQEFLEIAKANKSKSCPRPVLRGEALPGTAAADIIAVAEPSGDDDACAAALTEERDLNLRNSYFGYGEDSPHGFPARKLGTVRPFANDAPDREPIDDLLGACAAELDTIGRAVAHEDACSPYLPGVRGNRSIKKYIHLSTLVAISAVARAREGDVQGAIQSLFDALRFGQDLHRGGASVMEASVATAGASRLVPALEWILNQSEPLGSELLEQMDRELEALVATEPHPPEFLEGEAASSGINFFLEPLLRKERLPADIAIFPDKEEREPNPLEGSIGIIALHKIRLAYALSCEQTDSPATCFANLEKTSDRVLEEIGDKTDSSSIWFLKIQSLFGSPSQETEIEVLTLVAITVVAFRNYVQKHGQTRFYLGALRLLAKYRALAESTSSCPGLEAFDGPPLAAARVDPYSGERIRVTRVGDGRFVLRSPGELEFGEKPEDAIAVHVSCPLAGALPAE